MLDNEGIDDMLTRFTKITNALSSLGDNIDNDQKIRKVIRALPKSWEVKATTLKELNDREEMDFTTVEIFKNSKFSTQFFLLVSALPVDRLGRPIWPGIRPGRPTQSTNIAWNKKFFFARSRSTGRSTDWNRDCSRFALVDRPVDRESGNLFFTQFYKALKSQISSFPLLQPALLSSLFQFSSSQI